MVMPINRLGARRGMGFSPAVMPGQAGVAPQPQQPMGQSPVQTGQPMGGMQGRRPIMRPAVMPRPVLPPPDFTRLGGGMGRGMYGGRGMFGGGMPMGRGRPMGGGMIRGRRFGAGGGMGTPPGTGGQPGMPGQPGMGAQDNGGLRRRIFARIQARRAARAAGVQPAPIAPQTEPINNG